MNHVITIEMSKWQAINDNKEDIWVETRPNGINVNVNDTVSYMIVSGMETAYHSSISYVSNIIGTIIDVNGVKHTHFGTKPLDGVNIDSDDCVLDNWMNEPDDKLFNEIMLNNKKLSDCKLEYRDTQYSMYVDIDDVDGTCTGFYALVVEFVSSDEIEVEDHWDGSDLIVNIVFNVIARFDGVRHLEFNREGSMPGYIYYPGMEAMVKMFTKLREIEQEHCSFCD